MLIHVVKPGDTVYSIALEYGIPMSQLILDNGLETSSRLAVGQALVVQFPTQTHTVQPGETLASIAAAYQLPLRQLYRNNPILGGIPELYPGQTLCSPTTARRRPPSPSTATPIPLSTRRYSNPPSLTSPI